nr:ORF1a [Mamastrovirus 18]
MKLVKGHFAVVGATILSFFTKFFEVPDMVVVAVMVVWRLFIIMQLNGDRVEVKDANGKTINVVPSKPAWLARAAGIKDFVQSARHKIVESFTQKVRKKTVVPVRVLTNSILGIESSAGIGTGFRVANNIITASHVVGSDDVVRVSWGASNFSAKVLKHLGNDVAILGLPAEAHPVQPFRFAKECKDGTVVITGMNKNGDYIVAAAEGVIIGDQWTYAVQTLDGMSGAPITNENGRIVGVHLSNTGFTGGGAVLRSSDVHEESEIEKLRRELALLKSQAVPESTPSQDKTPPMHLSSGPLDQSKEVHPLPESFVFDCTDIVGLIREAVRREIEVLRHELDPMSQAKGKTKMKARLGKHKSKRIRAFTEEEYKALQEKGYTRDQLRDMAAVIIERMNEDSYDYDDGGYPEFAEISEEERREIERDWLGTSAEHEDYVRDSYRQSYVVEAVPVESDYNPKTHPWDVYDKYSLCMYHVTEADVKIVGQALLDYDRFLTKWMARNLRGNEWQSGIDIAKELKELADAKLRLEILMTQNGLTPFCQRKKKERKPRTIKKTQKNVKTPPQEGGESPTP